jgi:hypothetical protein
MRFWKDGGTYLKGIGDLSEKAQAVLGLWLVGTRDPEKIFEHLPDRKNGYDFRDIKKLLASKHPTIKKIRERGGIGFWVPIEGAVRCQDCGQKINAVPCRICDANARERCYSALNRREAPVGTPTAALPGTSKKLRVLKERVASGLSLWHPKDAVWPSGTPCKALERKESLLTDTLSV